MRAGTSIHISALDGIVNVNSLFTLAVFLGLAWNPGDPSNTLITNPSCIPSQSLSQSLITYHVYSFSSFLFSSLSAFGLKQAIRNPSNPDITRNVEFLVRINKSLLRVGMVVSGVGSVAGCGFLMMALVNVVQVKVGAIGCGESGYALAAILPLVVFVPIGLVVYVGVVVYAFLS